MRIYRSVSIVPQLLLSEQCIKAKVAAFHPLRHRPRPWLRYKSDQRSSIGRKPTDATTHEAHSESAMRRRLEDLEGQSRLAEPRKYVSTTESAQAVTQDINDDASTIQSLEILKSRLAGKIEAANFDSENAAALSYSHLPSLAAKEIRDTAIAKPWTGTESLEDAVLRGLHEAKPRLRGAKSTSSTSSKRALLSVDFATARRLSKGERIIAAKDRAGSYPLMKKSESELTEDEKETRSRLFRERFEPAARAMPNTIQGLTALANERIEEAIAKGLFKNLPKGPIERDHHAQSPFIDTTEYLLNRMIQRQEIVPPWIEKQQELQKEVKAFRNRIRMDWKRHVVRTIASWGGSPEACIERAKKYATAEKLVNPDPAAPISATSQSASKNNNWQMNDMATKIGEDIISADGKTDNIQTKETSELPDPILAQHNTQVNEDLPPMTPFRDSIWEKRELSYHTVSIENLNNMTRSYNLQAPRLAQRPFLNIKREILACYRDVMPTIPAEMIERANNPNYGKVQLQLADLPQSGQDKGFLDLLKSGERGKVYDESGEKAYGLKEFWRDLFSRGH